MCRARPGVTTSATDSVVFTMGFGGYLCLSFVGAFLWRMIFQLCPTGVLFTRSTFRVDSRFPGYSLFVFSIASGYGLVSKFSTYARSTRRAFNVYYVSTMLRYGLTVVFRYLFTWVSYQAWIRSYEVGGFCFLKCRGGTSLWRGFNGRVDWLLYFLLGRFLVFTFSRSAGR